MVGDNVVYYNNAWTCSPSGLPRYVNNGDGTLTDNQTELMWELKTGTPSSTLCSGGATADDVNNCYSWSSSGTAADGTLFTTFLATLNGGDYYSPSAGQDVSDGPTACFANHCDWRIPTIAELQAIIETSAAGCYPFSQIACIDSAFGSTKASCYWSSSEFAVYPTIAWYVCFDKGPSTFVLDNYKTNVVYARAVRSGA
ncbi:MAG: DUF1566 domain-containing protein [Steroidobacteraceae bacterium]